MFSRFVMPALALALAVPAAAEPTSVAVRYGDLDLTKADGRAALERRLTQAALRVCGDRQPRALSLIAAQRRCIADTRASYQPQVELALNAANARRVAVLADKLAVLASF